MKLKIVILFLTLYSITPALAQYSKKQITKSINSWYESHPDEYNIYIRKNESNAKVTNYYPDKKDQKNNLIQMQYKGMKITLAFTKSLDSITTHKDSLQAYFSYVSLSNIYSTIRSKNWNIHPQTPSSSLRNKGVTFNNGGNALNFTINWSIYTIMGYRNSKGCNSERQIMDVGISEHCYVSVRKKLPLVISVIDVPLN